jgi:hypothetical protein
MIAAVFVVQTFIRFGTMLAHPAGSTVTCVAVDPVVADPAVQARRRGALVDLACVDDIIRGQLHVLPEKMRFENYEEYIFG